MKKFSEIITEAVMKKNQVPYKDKILHYQAAQHRAGNKISWDEAKKHIEDMLKAIAKKEKKNKAAAKRAKNKESKGLTDSQFNKMMKGAVKDFMADSKGDGLDINIEDVVWDMAASMIYNPDVEKYVRNKMAKNSGRKPESISREMMIEFIADSMV